MPTESPNVLRDRLQIYLTHNYQFDFEASPRKQVQKQKKKDKKRNKNEGRSSLGDVDEGLLISQIEMFDLFQAQRGKVLRWLLANPEVRIGENYQHAIYSS